VLEFAMAFEPEPEPFATELAAPPVLVWAVAVASPLSVAVAPALALPPVPVEADENALLESVEAEVATAVPPLPEFAVASASPLVPAALARDVPEPMAVAST
jgi:hypothetical protein